MLSWILTDHICCHFRQLSDLYVSVQVWADNRPLTLLFYTGYKSFNNSYTSVIAFEGPSVTRNGQVEAITDEEADTVFYDML